MHERRIATRSLNPARPHAPGFSLIELVIVIAVMAVVTTIAVPNMMRGSDQRRLALALQRFASDAELAQQTARSMSGHVILRWSDDGSGYTLVGISNPDGAGDYTVRLSSPPYEVYSNASELAETDWLFDGHGNTETRSVVLATGNVSRSVQLVAPAGGRVFVRSAE
ncbi:MAG: prepilin-type N-terminal cleavage/methylation domain-containing protein [Planctomycetota bacterium]